MRISDKHVDMVMITIDFILPFDLYVNQQKMQMLCQVYMYSQDIIITLIFLKKGKTSQ